jgi:hypothetical protein
MTSFNSVRDLPAPPSAVFAALQNPVRLARWWGPDGFSNRFQVFEFQPGGRWVFDMVGPDGRVYPNASVFERIEPDRRVVIRHACAPFFTLTIALEPVVVQGEAHGTRVHWTQVFDDPAVAQAVAPIVAPANEQNLDRWTAEVVAGSRG